MLWISLLELGGIYEYFDIFRFDGLLNEVLCRPMAMMTNSIKNSG